MRLKIRLKGSESVKTNNSNHLAYIRVNHKSENLFCFVLLASFVLNKF